MTSARHKAAPTAIALAVIVAVIVGLSAWYLSRPVPLMIQGEADSTRIDIAARVDGRIAKIPVQRGQDVPAGTILLQIDNPELVAKLAEAVAAKGVADAELARIHAGTRAETVAVRKAEIDRTAADVALAQQTYDRLQQAGRRPIRDPAASGRGDRQLCGSPSAATTRRSSPIRRRSRASRRRKCIWRRPRSCAPRRR